MALYQKNQVYIYNTRHKNLEPFVAKTPPYVGMYVCGPTVYGEPHLGHARGAVTFDVVYRYLNFLGYKVRYVRNITDVGHLEDEVLESGEDKISKKAALEKLEPMEIVQRYTVAYHRAMEAMGVLPPSIEPCATGHMPEQIRLIEKLLDSGYAYESGGSVYFDVAAYAQKHTYGVLSGKVLEDLQSGSRELEGQEVKRNPFDFALWKRAAPTHLMHWSSPWGEGFPGWHLECTAMSTKYLGETFDIHGGGLDLQFPHHECEIAQNVGAYGEEPVTYWMHNNMLTIDGKKMSKSLGNFINLEQMFSGGHPLLTQAHSPMTVRFFILQAHYGSPLDFSDDSLKAAERGLQKLLGHLKAAENLQSDKKSDPAAETALQKPVAKFFEAMNQDFNTAQAIAALFEMGSAMQSLAQGGGTVRGVSPASWEAFQKNYRAFVTDVLGIRQEKKEDESKLKGVLDLLTHLREEARSAKNYALSDQIRDELQKLGISLHDEKDGRTTYSM